MQLWLHLSFQDELLWCNLAMSEWGLRVFVFPDTHLCSGDSAWATALWCWVEFSGRLQSEEMGSKAPLIPLLGLWVRFPRSVVLEECLHCLSLLPRLLFVLHSIPSGFHSLLKFVSLRWPPGCKNWGGFNTDNLFLNFSEPSWKSAMLYLSLAVPFKSLGTSAYHCSTEWQNLLLR